MWPEGDAENGASDTPDDRKQSAPAASEVPEGWKTQREIGASVAVPADYTVEPYPYGKDSGPGSDETDHVAFREEEGEVHKQLVVQRGTTPPEPEGAPEDRAVYWHDSYMSNTDFADQQATLSDAKVNGRESKVLTLTYDPGDGHLWRKKELFYNHEGEEWKLVLDWEVHSVEDTSSDQFFDRAVRTFTPQ